MNKQRYLKKQQGVSLIELMISMVVGLFLLVGLVTSFINTKDTEKTRAAISDMDANANVIFDILRKTITHAGYVSIDPVVQGVVGFHTVSDGNVSAEVCRNGSFRETDERREAIQPTRDLNNTDTITVISLADNPCKDGDLSCPSDSDVNPQALVYYDCAGGGMARDADVVACSTDVNVGMQNRAEAKIYNTFSLINDTNSDDDRTMFCDGSKGGEVAIAENVEAIQYLYGVKDDNDNVTFTDATTVENANNWELVSSVQIALLMRSESEYLLDKPSSKTFYSLLDKQVDIAVADRQRLFRVYTTTINLENMD